MSKFYLPFFLLFFAQLAAAALINDDFKLKNDDLLFNCGLSQAVAWVNFQNGYSSSEEVVGHLYKALDDFHVRAKKLINYNIVAHSFEELKSQLDAYSNRKQYKNLFLAAELIAWRLMVLFELAGDVKICCLDCKKWDIDFYRHNLANINFDHGESISKALSEISVYRAEYFIEKNIRWAPIFTNRGFLGINTIVFSIIFDVYPIMYSTKTYKAHGIYDSVSGLTNHDYQHAAAISSIDQKSKETYKKIYLRIMSVDYRLKKSLLENKRALFLLFYMIHELEYNFSQDNDPDDNFFEEIKYDFAVTKNHKEMTPALIINSADIFYILKVLEYEDFQSFTSLEDLSLSVVNFMHKSIRKILSGLYEQLKHDHKELFELGF